jgi:hypothetical protein
MVVMHLRCRYVSRLPSNAKHHRVTQPILLRKIKDLRLRISRTNLLNVFLKKNRNIVSVTYSTSEPATPVSRPLFFTPKKTLSWRYYLDNHIIEFSRNFIIELHLYENYYSRSTKL